MVVTALGTSRVWVTLGYGILNEVYWPATGEPQIRDLGFIVAEPSGWFEVKRVNRYQISKPEDCVPLPQVTHQGDRYRLVIEVVPDPSRDVVLISYRLSGDDVKLYALLAPHLGNSGEHNNARAAADLTAWKEATALCLLSDCGFSRSGHGRWLVSPPSRMRGRGPLTSNRSCLWRLRRRWGAFSPICRIR
jgi:glucoamylase